MVLTTEQYTVTRAVCTVTVFLQLCSNQQWSQTLSVVESMWGPSKLVNIAYHAPILGITVYSCIGKALRRWPAKHTWSQNSNFHVMSITIAENPLSERHLCFKFIDSFFMYMEQGFATCNMFVPEMACWAFFPERWPWPSAIGVTLVTYYASAFWQVDQRDQKAGSLVHSFVNVGNWVELPIPSLGWVYIHS